MDAAIIIKSLYAIVLNVIGGLIASDIWQKITFHAK